MTKYLRNRPFLVISYTRIPNKGSRTHVKGWSQENEDAWEVIENAVVVDRVSDNMLSGADYVIDLLDRTLIKNRLGGSDETVAKAYMERYAHDIKEAVTRWVKVNSGNTEAVHRIAQDLGITLPSKEEKKED